MDNFTFDKKRHVYTLNGKPLTGTTTVLGIISKGDGLIQWSANMAVDYIKSKVFEVDVDTLYNKVCEEARKAWVTTRDSAGKSGTDVHEVIEGIIKRAIALDGFIQPVEASFHTDSAQVSQFIKWAVEGNIRFLESEKMIYSKEHWLAGTVDFVFEKNGEVYVGDLKTAKAIYPTNFWQVSAYQMMLQEMGLYPKIKGFCIVRVGKDGSFEVAENYSYDDNISGFLSALNIYRKLNLITQK